jgi:ubiquinone biosynthesis protein
MYKNSVQRFREIVRVLAYYGFGFIVDSTINKRKQKSPQNLRKACEELGPTFIKIGQILSTRPDLLSEAYINELSKLQDSVSPESFENVNKTFFSEFNKSIDEVFKYFDKKPLASASIAQVHKATLMDGREVIVKIQRPEISKKMKMDISILSKILNLTKARFNDSIIDPKEALDELMESTSLELDFRNEAKNINHFRKLNKDVNAIYAPYIVEKLCTTKVLTMEKIDGFKVTDMKKLKSGGYDLDDLGNKLVLSFFKQIFEDNFFHGDPHPGNILINEGKICYIDFGIMGTLSKSLQQALGDVIIAIVYQDINKLISVLMSIGIKKGYINRNQLYEDIDYLMASYLSSSIQNIKVSSMLQEVFDAARRNNIKLPKDLTLLIRSMVIVEGVAVKICPDMNFMQIAIPYVKSKNRFSIFKQFDFDEFLMRYMIFAKDTSKLPSKIIELSDSILKGRAKLQLDVNGLERSVNQLNKMINRIVFAVIISSMIIGSSFILNSNIGPKFYDISIIGITGYSIAAIMGFWLLISIIRSGKL